MVARRSIARNLIVATAMVLALVACRPKSESKSIVAIQIYVSPKGYPVLSFTGPPRRYELFGSLEKIEAQINGQREGSKIFLTGSMKWMDREEKHASVTCRLTTPEPVAIELIGVAPDRGASTDAEPKIRRSFPAGTHEFVQDFYVVHVYTR